MTPEMNNVTFDMLREKSTKFNNFVDYLMSIIPFTLAFSGGVDSTFLFGVMSRHPAFKACHIVTINTPYMPKWELNEAKSFANQNDMTYSMLKLSIPECVKNNPVDKCYHCKKEVFKQIINYSNTVGIHTIIDGTNFDDIDDYRPGMKALKELDVKSPMLESKITKSEIRTWSKLLGLDTWDKPAYACLLTRIEPNQTFTLNDLHMIEAAERVMFSLGVREVRVRKMGTTARIEVLKSYMQKIIELSEVITQKFRDIGFEYVTLDLIPYRKSGLKYKTKG